MSGDSVVVTGFRHHVTTPGRHSARDGDRHNFQVNLPYISDHALGDIALAKACANVFLAVRDAGGEILLMPNDDNVLEFAAVAPNKPRGIQHLIDAYEYEVELFHRIRQTSAERRWGPGIPPLPRESATGIVMREVGSILIPVFDPKTRHGYSSGKIAEAAAQPFLGMGKFTDFDPLVMDKPQRLVIVNRREGEQYLDRLTSYMEYLLSRAQPELPDAVEKYLSSGRAQYLLRLVDPAQLWRASDETQDLFVKQMNRIGDGPFDRANPDDLARQLFPKFAGARFHFQCANLTVESDGMSLET